MSFDLNLSEMSLFNDLKEVVSVVRPDATENHRRSTIATGLECVIQPLTSVDRQRDALELQGGVAIDQSEMFTVLPMNTSIKKGDFLVRGDGSELRIESVLSFPRTNYMELGLKSVGVA